MSRETGSCTSAPFDRSTELALRLVEGGSTLVVVGGTARRILGSSRRPLDLDVVVQAEDVPALVGALSPLGVQVSSQAMLRARSVALRTAWGPLDVFVCAKLPGSRTVDVDGCRLMLRAADRWGDRVTGAAGE